MFAAGAFTGIITEYGILKSITGAAVAHVPSSLARHIPFTLGVVSMPLSFLFDPDSFYFGIVPVIAEVAKMLGISPVQVAAIAAQRSR